MLGSNTTNLFETIPDETFLHIIGNLDPIELANISAVSHKFRNISLDHRFLKECLNKYFPTLSAGTESYNIEQLRAKLKQGATLAAKRLVMIDEIRQQYYPDESFQTIKDYFWKVVISRNSRLQTNSACLNSTQVKLIMFGLCVELGSIQELENSNKKVPQKNEKNTGRRKVRRIGKKIGKRIENRNDDVSLLPLKSHFESLILTDSIDAVVVYMISKLFENGRSYMEIGSDTNESFLIDDLIFLDENTRNDTHDDNNDKDVLNYKLFMHYLDNYWNLIRPVRKQILFEHVCKTDHQALFDFLIKKKISITPENLRLAVKAGNARFVEKLLKHKSDDGRRLFLPQAISPVLDIAFDTEQLEIIRPLLKALFASNLLKKNRFHLERFDGLFNSIEILLNRRTLTDSLTTTFVADNQSSLATRENFKPCDNNILKIAINNIAQVAFEHRCYDVLFYLLTSFYNELSPEYRAEFANLFAANKMNDCMKWYFDHTEIDRDTVFTNGNMSHAMKWYFDHHAVPNIDYTYVHSIKNRAVERQFILLDKKDVKENPFDINAARDKLFLYDLSFIKSTQNEDEGKDKDKGKEKLNKVKESISNATIEPEIASKYVLNSFHAKRTRSSVRLLKKDKLNVKKRRVLHP